MTPHPAEKTDSRLHSPLSSLDADTTPLPARLSKRSAWAAPPSARDPDLSPLVVHRHTHYLSDLARRLLLRRAQPEVIQDPADRETIDDVRHDLERASALAALEWIHLVDLRDEPRPTWRAPLLRLLRLGPLRPKGGRGCLVRPTAPRPVRVVRVEIAGGSLRTVGDPALGPRLAGASFHPRAPEADREARDARTRGGSFTEPAEALH